MKSETMRISHELQSMKEKIKENAEKIKVNKTLPYLVSNVIEVSKLFRHIVIVIKDMYYIFNMYIMTLSLLTNLMKNFFVSFKISTLSEIV